MTLSLTGIPTPEIMEKVDIVKRLLLTTLWWLTPNKSLAIFRRILPKENGEFAQSAYGIGEMANLFGATEDASHIIETIVGYDLAYRLRIQDVLQTSDMRVWRKYPIRTLRKAWKIYCRRESIIGSYMLPKSRKIYAILMVALLFSPFRRRFKRMFNVPPCMKMGWTEEDLKWIKVRKDYKFGI